MSSVEKGRVLFVMSSVVFVLALVWTLIGENSFKMVAIFVTFASFLYFGVDYEAKIRAEHSHDTH